VRSPAADPVDPGSGLAQTAGSGFSGHVGAPQGTRLPFEIGFDLRGHDEVTLIPSAQDTRWHAASSWPHPSFLGGFLPNRRQVGADGFVADWRIGNLALNRPIVSVGEPSANDSDKVRITLVDPVDLYDEVGARPNMASCSSARPSSRCCCSTF
jgi:inner membrane protein